MELASVCNTPNFRDVSDDPTLALEVQRLLVEKEQLQRHVRQHQAAQEGLLQASRAALYELGTPEVAAACAKHASQLAGGAQSLVCTREPAGMQPRGAWPEDRQQAIWESHGDLIRKVLVRSRADFYTHESGGGCVFVAPIVDAQRQVLGAVAIVQPQGRPVLSEVQLRALDTLTTMFATSLSRARLFERLNDWSLSLEMVLAFNSAVNRHLPPTKLVQRLVELAIGFLKADGGMAGFTIPAADGLQQMTAEGYYAAGQWHSYARRWQPRDGAPGFVLDAEFVYLSNGYAEDPAADTELVQRFGVRKLLCVPIRDAAQRVLGFFLLHRAECSPPFSWQDAAFLETLGNSTAVAIENVRLLHTLELKNGEIRGLSGAHVQRLEEERRHIARELHDETGQMLVGIKLGLQVLARKLPAGQEDLSQELDRLGQLIKQSSTQLRDLARNLRPPALDNLGLDAAIEQLAREQERRTGIAISVCTAHVPLSLAEPIRTALYRIAQEALTNVAKHADASCVTIAIEGGERSLVLTIQDDGCGFDPAVASTGLGMLGMKERADMLGGELEVRSDEGKGAHICLTIPLS